jgi:hypothetical protein
VFQLKLVAMTITNGITMSNVTLQNKMIHAQIGASKVVKKEDIAKKMDEHATAIVDDVKIILLHM